MKERSGGTMYKNTLRFVKRLFAIYFSLPVISFVLFIASLILMRFLLPADVGVQPSTTILLVTLFHSTLSAGILTIGFPKLLHAAVNLLFFLDENKSSFDLN